MNFSPSFVATILTENIKNLEREGASVDQLSDEKIFEAFDVVNRGLTAKESIVELLKWASQHRDSQIEDAIDILGLRIMSFGELEKMIKKIVEDEKENIIKQPEKAFNRLLGLIMGDVRGKADVKTVTNLLEEAVKSLNTT